MDTRRPRTSLIVEVFRFFSLTYHGAVKDVRDGHRNALIGLFMEMFQSLALVIFFALFISVLGMRGAIRGNFILFVMSGVFLYMTHVKALGKVNQAGKANNPMLRHAPVTTLLNIAAASLGGLYIQVLSMIVILFATHVLMEEVQFYNLPLTALCFFLAWFSGLCVGVLFTAFGVFFPKIASVLSTAYTRLNMIFSGKMMAANALPGYLLPMFDWNPLFHAIDQARGAIFINYTPRYTSIEYIIWTSLAILVVGFMLEHWARKYASESWATRV